METVGYITFYPLDFERVYRKSTATKLQSDYQYKHNHGVHKFTTIY